MINLLKITKLINNNTFFFFLWCCLPSQMLVLRWLKCIAKLLIWNFCFISNIITTTACVLILLPPQKKRWQYSNNFSFVLMIIFSVTVSFKGCFFESRRLVTKVSTMFRLTPDFWRNHSMFKRSTCTGHFFFFTFIQLD